MTPPWTGRESSASGQVFEFRLWALLTEQSRGGLHVFLPLADRGIDALVHRLGDGAYLPVQAKARSVLVDGEVHLVVWANSLQDDKALIVSGLITEGGVGPTMLVVPEGDFKRLAELSSANGRPVYSMGFGMQPRSNSRWLPYLVPSERLVEQFGIPPMAGASADEAVPLTPVWRSEEGFLGEVEVIRRLAASGSLDLFRAFPDSETAELVILHLASRHVLGLQIKTIGVDLSRPAGTVSILASSFRPSPATYFVVLAWLRDEKGFHEECLFIPSNEIRGICEPSERAGHLEFDWRPGSRSHTHLDRFRRPLSSVLSEVEVSLERS
ncbi:MAG TPA: hypothetical protein VGG90_02720 [Candidatus Dormibacteraeota bacterium]